MKNSKAKLWFMTFASFVFIALAIFLSAGTFAYWQAWGYLAATAVTSIPLAAYFAKDPILLENRTRIGPAAEQRKIQKVILTCAAVPFVAAFVVPALDHRFGWSYVPAWLSVAGDLLIIASMWMVYRVFKENSFGAATVEITSNQKVVSTGPYAIVRNPMYSCAVLYFIGLSLALGSYWGFAADFLAVLGLVWRLYDEENFLAQNLPGYPEYQAKVRWHLVPGIY
jgi:protein-S-isoprenylcysteine O-methyltransferase Ste14